MKTTLRVLHLEDDPTDAELIRAMLEAEDFAPQVTRVQTQVEFGRALAQGSFDLIISDFTLPSFNGMRALSLAREVRPDLPFILFSGTIGEEAAVESLKSGATDYVLKHRPEKLISAVRRALREVQDRRRGLEAEARYRSIFNNAIEGICTTTPQGRFIAANPSLARILGYDSVEDLTAGVQDIGLQVYARPEQRAEFRRRVERSDVVKGFECQVRRKDGAEIWISINAHIVRDRDGTPTCYECTIEDITERKRAEDRIREQATLLDEAHDAICVADMERCIVYWNKGAERLYGWSAREVIGKPLDQLLLPTAAAPPVAAHRALLEQGRWQGELLQVTKLGEELTVESHWSLLRTAEGTPKSVLVISTNITEKKRAQEEVLRTQRVQCIGALAGGIAHDLNNILSPVLMVSDLFREKLSDERDRRMLDLVRSSAQRGAEMVRQILTFARGVRGDLAAVDLKLVVGEVARLIRETLPRSIQIKTRIPGGLHPVLGNPTQLHQVLMNLCVNARDAMPNGGSLAIDAENVLLEERPTTMQPRPASGPYVALSVTDTGVGIPANLLPRVFEPFFTTKAADKGTGLGLSTVIGIVKSCGGFVEVTSQVGIGTTFRLFLPVAGAAERERAGDRPPLGLMGHGERILVVDDESAVLAIARLALEKSNFKVVTANDGCEGLARYQQYQAQIKVVLTDLMMPRMDGVGLIKGVRRIDPQAKVICATGAGSRAKLGEVEQLNVQAFLDKPYTIEALVRTVAAVLAARAAG